MSEIFTIFQSVFQGFTDKSEMFLVFTEKTVNGSEEIGHNRH